MNQHAPHLTLETAGLLSVALTSAILSALEERRLRDETAYGGPLHQLLREAPPEHHWSIVCAYVTAQRVGRRLLEKEAARRKRAQHHGRRDRERAAELEYLRPLHLRIQRARALHGVLQDLWGILRSAPG